MTVYVADTHGLIAYLSAPARLGSRGRRAFAEAVAGQAEIVIPVIVFAEMIFAVERGRVQLDVAAIVQRIQTLPYFRIVPLTLERVLELANITAIPELHDRMIVAETLAQQATLITHDLRVRRSAAVPTIW